MMRIKSLSVCLVAVFVVAGLLATSASAAATPTWFECAKLAKNGENKYTGKYKDKLCGPTEEASPAEITEGKKNKYELKEGLGKGKGFKGKGGEAVLHVKTYLGDNTVKCGSSKSEGKPALPNLEKGVSITFKKCEALGAKCASAGAKAGEIKITGLEGELGYIKGEKSEVGVKLMSEAEPGTETTSGGVISKFTCSETGKPKFIEATVAREVIGEVLGDVNVVPKNSSVVDTALEQYGEHEFEGKKFTPDVNILGWENELAEIEACSGQECVAEHPAHILAGEFCGELIETVLHAPMHPAGLRGPHDDDSEQGRSPDDQSVGKLHRRRWRRRDCQPAH